MGRTEMLSSLLLGNQKARDHLEQSGVDKRTILKCLLKEYGDRLLTGLNWLRTGQVVGSKNVENFLSS
jgi:ferritin-like protein